MTINDKILQKTLGRLYWRSCHQWSSSFLPVLLSPVPRQHAFHIRSAHRIRGMYLHGVKGLPLHQPVQQFDGIAALICKISQVMVEIQHLDLDAISLRLPDQRLGFIHGSGALISPGCRAEII